MSNEKVYLREGYPFAFEALFNLGDGGVPGIPARYTNARFAVRLSADAALDALVDADQDSGITINHGTGIVSVSIGATATEDLGINDATKQVTGELRLEDPNNPDDRQGGSFPIYIKPGVIADA